MKARKALKRLNKIETLLSGVIDSLPANSDGLGDLLASAKDAVARAESQMKAGKSIPTPKKPAARAAAPRGTRLSAKGRKKISAAAKKRWAAARRKGINPVTGRELKRTA
jgi:hypothetical protein